jgi:Family of unknown function (DUF5684)
MLGQDTGYDGPAAGVLVLLWVAILVFYIAAWWRVFTKAGQPGWAALIPIYNFIILLKIARRPIWWIVLLLIPIVNIVVIIIVSIDVAKNFGKTAGFGVGLALLGLIFYPILAWGSARYIPAPAGTASSFPPTPPPPMPPGQAPPPPPPP